MLIMEKHKGDCWLVLLLDDGGGFSMIINDRQIVNFFLFEGGGNQQNQLVAYVYCVINDPLIYLNKERGKAINFKLHQANAMINSNSFNS